MDRSSPTTPVARQRSIEVGTVAPADAMAPLILALDVGTSSLRTLLFDRHGHAVTGLGVRMTYDVRTTPDGGVELDADALVAGATEAIDTILSQSGALASHIAAVACDTFWHNMIALDGDGKAISPVFTWADTRATKAAAELKQELDERAVHSRTGAVLHASYLPAKLRWLHHQDPDLVKRTAHWVSIGEYLYWRFLGKLSCSVSMASGTGLLDQHTRQWDSQVLQAAGVTPEHLSPLTDGATPLVGLRDEFHQRWPALRNVAWFPAAGDGACSNTGSGCAGKDRFALMIGTSGAMRVCFPASDVATRWGLFCYHANPEYFVIGGALSNGGILWEWLQRSLRLPSTAATERALAQTQPDAHGLTVLPFLAGERSPNWVGDARAAFVGVSLSTEPLDFVRASLEAVSYRFALIYRLLRTVVPGSPRIVANGGAVLHSPLWLQMLADVLNAPVTASAEAEATSRGAALLALLSLGTIPSLSDPSVAASTARTYRPDARRHERYQAGAERQNRLYHQLIGPSAVDELDAPAQA
jgi:gluconokinase